VERSSYLTNVVSRDDKWGRANCRRLVVWESAYSLLKRIVVCRALVVARGGEAKREKDRRLSSTGQRVETKKHHI
jgi:hypothetical protein